MRVSGRTITLDALHSCPKTAQLIVEGGGHYVMPVKGNRQTLLDDIRILDFEAAPSHHQPQAHRHYAAHQAEAVREVVRPAD